MAAILFSGIAAVHAQGQQQDPSARVARTSFLQGDVSFRPGAVDQWASATLNYPLTTGDHLWTDVNARAELHVGPNAIRLAPETAFEILNLDDNHLQLRLTQGSALIRLRRLDAKDNVEIDTPTGAVTLIRDGTYRIDVSADGATSTLTARSGDAEVLTNGQTISVRSDEMVLFTADGASQDLRNAPPMDEYDQWAYARDRSEDQSVSARYVTRDMTGYEDLDRNGTWSDDPQYGRVWAPTQVASDWAPYRYGRWVWVDPYGWTWIDDAPWGFAPFHYGRWAYTRSHWVWAPGIVLSRPVYAPALVVFVGGNDYEDSRWDGRRNVAWFPLAPNEVYRPAYRVSDGYVRRINVTNIDVTNINITNVNVTNIQYRNQRVSGAMTAVPQDQFAGSRRIGRSATVVPVDQARYTHVVGDGAPVPPTLQSIRGRRQSATPVSVPPEAVQNRQVVSKNAPPPRRVAFTPNTNVLNTNVPITNQPNTNVPVVPNTRPNINVQRYPAGQVQPQGNVNPKAAPASSQNPNLRRVPNVHPIVQPIVHPNVNVRPAQSAQPNMNARPVPSDQPNVTVRTAQYPRLNPNDRPMSHTDGPAPVNGSPNAGPAHTVEPNTQVRQVPSAQTAPAPRSAPRAQPVPAPRAQSGAPPNMRPAQPPRAAAPQSQGPQAVDRSMNDRRRAPAADNGNRQPAQNNRPSRRG